MVKLSEDQMNSFKLQQSKSDYLKPVEDCIIHAIKTLNRLYGKVCPADARSMWTEIIRDADDKKDEIPDKIKIIPRKEEIDEMEVVLDNWLPLLTHDDARVLWDKCSGMRWKELEYKYGHHRSTLDRYRVRALKKILKSGDLSKMRQRATSATT